MSTKQKSVSGSTGIPVRHLEGSPGGRTLTRVRLGLTPMALRPTESNLWTLARPRLPLLPAHIRVPFG
jgi:hypothetical protein